MCPRITLLLVVLAALLWPAPARAEADWRWPVRGDVVSGYRNGANPYAGGQHRGIDIAAAEGTPVVAAVEGTVRFAGALGSAGNVVSIRSADDRHDTSYLHLGSIEVRAGAAVRAGARIGTVGITGRRSAAEPHLHFGVRAAGERHAYRDPLTLLPPPAATPRAPAPRPLPARRTLPLPSIAPLSRTALPRRVAPLPRTAPLPLPAPVSEHPRALRQLLESVPVPGLGPALDPPAHAPAQAVARAAARDPRALDLGWLVACLAMVAAAGLLARPRGPAESLRRGGRLAASAPAPAAPEAADSIATWPTTSPRRSTT